MAKELHLVRQQRNGLVVGPYYQHSQQLSQSITSYARINSHPPSPQDEDDEEGHGCVDYSHLDLKPDHPNRPMWVLPDARVILESQSPIYRQAYGERWG